MSWVKSAPGMFLTGGKTFILSIIALTILNLSLMLALDHTAFNKNFKLTAFKNDFS